MEYLMSEEHQKAQFRGRVAGGIFLLIYGVAIFMERSGVFKADWLISAGTILLGIGVVNLIKHNFKKTFAWVLTAIGAILLFDDIIPSIINKSFILPAILVVIGVSFVAKAIAGQKKKVTNAFEHFVSEDATSDNYFESNSVFGGVEKIVMSKNFKGAKIKSVFGGQEINLMQANIENNAHLEVNVLFGGVELIVPSNWKVVSDLSSIFGGVEDSRPLYSEGWKENEKTLFIKGSCAFGGIEIKSFG